MNKIYDVIIVGAGPAGSFCAANLAESGLSVLVLDSQKEVKRKVCGEYLCPLGVTLLKDYRLEDIVNAYPKVMGMNIFSPKGRKLETNFPKSENISDYGISVNRKTFDEKLIRLAALKGANIQMNTPITKITNGASFWTLEDVHQNSFKCRLLIGADGKRSIVSKSLELDVEVKRKRIAIHCWKILDHEIERKGQMHIFKDGSYIGLDPTGTHEINISLVCRPTMIKKHGGQLGTLNHYIQESSYLKDFIGVIEEDLPIYTVSPVSHKVKSAIYKNAALIGDAQGFIDPLTGEGILNALWTASILSREVISQSHGICDYSKALKAYDKSRLSTLKQKVKLNEGFQYVIKNNIIVELLAIYLSKFQKRADSFIGIIGNIYSPYEGIKKILF